MEKKNFKHQKHNFHNLFEICRERKKVGVEMRKIIFVFVFSFLLFFSLSMSQTPNLTYNKQILNMQFFG